jgi:hypothetical protein
LATGQREKSDFFKNPAIPILATGWNLLSKIWQISEILNSSKSGNFGTLYFTKKPIVWVVVALDFVFRFHYRV